MSENIENIEKPEVILIRELPEKERFNDEDYLVSQDLQDTWKVKIDAFRKFINDKIDPLQLALSLSIDNFNELTKKLELTDIKRNEEFNIMKQFVYDELSTDGISDNKKVITDMIVPIGYVKLNTPTDNIKFPKFYSMLLSVSVVDENQKNIENGISYISAKIKNETFPYFTTDRSIVNSHDTEYKLSSSTDTIATSLSEDGTTIYIYRIVKSNKLNIHVEYSMVSDNRSSFENSMIDVIIYPYSEMISTVPSQVLDVKSITYTDYMNSLISVVSKDYGFEKQFFDVYNRIRVLELKKPYHNYPIGTIYKTTKNENPKVILGGGDWVILNGGGIENIIETRNGATLVSTKTYTEYTWERIG